MLIKGKSKMAASKNENKKSGKGILILFLKCP